jgi:hypothetical protein
LNLVESEIADYVKERDNRQHETVLAEPLDTQYPGGVKGKKKDRTLLKACTESIQIDFRASALRPVI